MSCQCPSGYTGRFCESDIDACEVNMNPCYPGVQCKDLPAPANVTGYECVPCPTGFTGQGDSCSDINECDGSSQGCSHNCANTPGSFTCYCRQGYLLNRDGRTCDDMNECDPASDCMQGCVNTPGSYRCTCDEYFTVDPANPRAINKTILSVTVYMVDQPLTTTSTSTTAAKVPTTSNVKLSVIIIGGSVAGFLVMIIIIALVIKAIRRNHIASKPNKQREAIEMKTPHQAILDKYDFQQAYEMENRAMETAND